MILEYARLRETVRPPVRANPSDAGLDVFHNPERTDTVSLNPGENALLPTGLRFGVPHGFMLQVMNRSSMSAKRGLVVGAHCVDSGYDGEVFIDLHNIGNEVQLVRPGDKIAQVVMVPVIPFRAMETSTGNLYDWYPITISDRGEGSLGSTDT